MQDNGSSVGSSLGLIIPLAIMVFEVVAMWKVFTKAGHPGWACLIPIYNIYVLCKIADKPGWWVVLMFIPIVNIIIAVLVSLGVAANFGKGAGFAIGLVFLPIIFYPILAFSSAQHRGAPAGSAV